MDEHFAGFAVEVLYDAGRAEFEVSAPEPVAVIEGYWFAWLAFHPDSSVFVAGERIAGEAGAPESFFGCVAEIGEPVLDVEFLPVGQDHVERAAFEVDLAGEFEVAMVVAVIAEHQVDVDGIGGADEVGVRLDPGIVAVCGGGKSEGEKTGENQDEGGKETAGHWWPFRASESQ